MFFQLNVVVIEYSINQKVRLFACCALLMHKGVPEPHDFYALSDSYLLLLLSHTVQAVGAHRPTFNLWSTLRFVRGKMSTLLDAVGYLISLLFGGVGSLI